VKVAGKGHVVMRMQLGFSVPDSEKKTLTAADFGITEEIGGNNAPAPSAEAEKGGSTGPNANLFADSYVPSFFRYGDSVNCEHFTSVADPRCYLLYT
jgi:hypothetical protein